MRFLSLVALLVLTPALSAQMGLGEDPFGDDPFSGLWETFDSARAGEISPGYLDGYSDSFPTETGASPPRLSLDQGRSRYRVEAGGPGQVVVRHLGGGRAPAYLMVAGEDGRAQQARRYESAGGAVYVARLAPSGSRERGYAIFRTTESRDALVARDALRRARSTSLPRREVMFFDGTREGAPPGGFASGTEVFEAGGVASLPVTVYEPGGTPVARGAVASEGRAALMYFSGHYPYTSGGQVAGSPIDPWAVKGDGWRDHLETLVLAGCYAVDINAPGAGNDVVNHGRGVHGALWWKKFEGTLLGYRGMAPSNPGDSEVARRFFARVERLRPNPRDRESYSRTLAEAWMEVNVHQLGLSSATAIDAAGRYYYVRAKDVHLDGVPVRGSYRWTIADRAIWEPQNESLQQEFSLDRQVFAGVRKVLWGRYGGRPPSIAAVHRDPTYRQAVQAAGLDPDSRAMREKLQAFLDYEAHIFYDVPRPDYYQQAIIWLADRQGDGLTPPSLDAVEAHFTPPGRRPGAQRPPRRDLETMLFQEYAWRALNQPRWTGSGWGYPSAAEAEASLRRHFPIDAKRAEYIRYLDRYLGAQEASATD
jgi:hypothetical protein